MIHPPFFGLDVSDLTVKFLKAGGGNGSAEKKIDYFGEIAIPTGIVELGEIKKEEELSKILKGGLKNPQGKKIEERFVVASLPEEKSFVRVIQLPKLKQEDIAAAVRWEIEGNIPFPIDQVYYDYEIITPPEDPNDHMDVLITAFPRIIVESYSAVLREAGLRPVALELESQAISRAVISAELSRNAFIVVDIGMTRTSFIVFSAGSIILTISVSIGGQDFNRAISERFGVDPQEGERLKKEDGFEKTYQGAALADALTPYLSSLSEEIKKQIWFYRGHAEHHHGAEKDVSKILLVGGDANLIGLEKYLSLSLKKPVAVADPFINIYGTNSKTIPPIPKNLSLKYTTAAGLALRE